LPKAGGIANNLNLEPGSDADNHSDGSELGCREKQNTTGQGASGDGRSCRLSWLSEMGQGRNGIASLTSG